MAGLLNGQEKEVKAYANMLWCRATQFYSVTTLGEEWMSTGCTTPSSCSGGASGTRFSCDHTT